MDEKRSDQEEGMSMRYSSFNWKLRGKRGWIIGPFFGHTLTITLVDTEVAEFLAAEEHIDQLPQLMGWVDTPATIQAEFDRIHARKNG